MDRRFPFEKLEVWNLAMRLAEMVYPLTKNFPQDERFGMTSQVRRSVVSISSNLAEGGSRQSLKEQAHFSSIAYGSLMELISQLKLANKLGWLDKEKLEIFEEKAKEIAVKLSRLRQSQINRLQDPEVEYITASSSILSTPQHPLNTSTPQHFTTSTPQHLNISTPQHFNISTPQHFNIHPSAIIDQGANIGRGTKIWHFSHIMNGAVIGQNCNIGQNVFIASGVILGNNVKVQNNVSIYEGVTCDDDVFLGPSMVFTNVINPRSAVSRKDQYLPIKVGKGASIGANATIVCGNQIGQYAFVGAGAVVTRNVKDFALVVGNPAQEIGWMSMRGQRLEFDETGEAVCPEGGESYLLVDGKVELLEGEQGERGDKGEEGLNVARN